MRFVYQCHERASFYCYQTVDICAWRRTLRWCRGTTSGRTVFTGGWKRQNIQRHLYTTADGVAGNAAVSNQAIADVNETITSWAPVTKNSVMSIPGMRCLIVRPFYTAWPTVQSPTDWSSSIVNPLSKKDINSGDERNKHTQSTHRECLWTTAETSRSSSSPATDSRQQKLAN